MEIVDKDFMAAVTDGRWTVWWQWSSREPERFHSWRGEYKCTKVPGVGDRYNAEIQSWISMGWLVRWECPVKGVIPLLAVVQHKKNKVRTVMDYRELNGCVECSEGGSRKRTLEG